MELEALAVDCAWAFDGYVCLLDGEEESPVSVDEGRVTAERDGVYGVVLLAVGAAEEFCGGCDVEGDVAFELSCADEEGAGGDEDGASSIGCAGVDGGLEGGGIEGGAVAFGSVVADVVDAGAVVGGG